jgi:hypothetical protein
MMKHATLFVVTTTCALAGGCSFTSHTQGVEPAPVATQRTVYPDGSYRDVAVVPTTSEPVRTTTVTTFP